jgi:hypothetical protein
MAEISDAKHYCGIVFRTDQKQKEQDDIEYARYIESDRKAREKYNEEWKAHCAQIYPNRYHICMKLTVNTIVMCICAYFIHQSRQIIQSCMNIRMNNSYDNLFAQEHAQFDCLRMHEKDIWAYIFSIIGLLTVIWGIVYQLDYLLWKSSQLECVNGVPNFQLAKLIWTLILWTMMMGSLIGLIYFNVYGGVCYNSSSILGNCVDSIGNYRANNNFEIPFGAFFGLFAVIWFAIVCASK